MYYNVYFYLYCLFVFSSSVFAISVGISGPLQIVRRPQYVICFPKAVTNRSPTLISKVYFCEVWIEYLLSLWFYSKCTQLCIFFVYWNILQLLLWISWYKFHILYDHSDVEMATFNISKINGRKAAKKIYFVLSWNNLSDKPSYWHPKSSQTSSAPRAVGFHFYNNAV